MDKKNEYAHEEDPNHQELSPALHGGAVLAEKTVNNVRSVEFAFFLFSYATD